MANKVRLDLMVEEGAKRLLQDIARRERMSMSEMVEQLIMEHLVGPYGEVEEHDDSLALFDMLRIEDLKARVTHAIAAGKVWSFDTYRTLPEAERDGGDGIVYLPTGCEHYGVIAADMLVDEMHSDVISTYGGDGHPSLVRTVDVYLEWYQDIDSMHLNGLCVVPKGKSPTGFMGGDPFDWEAPAAWPEGLREEWNG